MGDPWYDDLWAEQIEESHDRERRARGMTQEEWDRERNALHRIRTGADGARIVCPGDEEIVARHDGEHPAYRAAEHRRVLREEERRDRWWARVGRAIREADEEGDE